MFRSKTSSFFRNNNIYVFGRNINNRRVFSADAALPYQGKSYDESLRIRQENLGQGLISFYKKKLLIHRGYMTHLWDHENRKYLDLFGGITTVSVGHCHPKVNAALKAQIEKLWHTTCIYVTPQMEDYAEKLVAKMPGNLKVCYFTNSGSEANDLAILLARLYTGRFEMISLRNDYHGMTQAVMGATKLSTWKHTCPVGFGHHGAMNADVYRGPWGGKNCRDSTVQTDRNCDCGTNECVACDNYVDQFEDVLKYDIPKQGMAGFLYEPIQGVGGSVQYPRDYPRRVSELVRQRGGLVIADEVQTGFGRLGDNFWGFETQGVTPDIVTMAKGIGNGFPMGAVVTTSEIASMLAGATYFNTFGGGPLSMAVGSAVLDVIEEEGLQENCKNVGNYFLERLSELRDKSTVIGDVRGKGLMLGLELVENKETRKPLPLAQAEDLFEQIKDEGVLVGRSGLYGTCLRFKPPMCLSKAEVDFGCDVMDRVLCRK